MVDCAAPLVASSTRLAAEKPEAYPLHLSAEPLPGEAVELAWVSTEGVAEESCKIFKLSAESLPGEAVELAWVSTEVIAEESCKLFKLSKELSGKTKIDFLSRDWSSLVEIM
jgi:hypothetical protein